MKRLVFDCETSPAPNAADHMPEFVAPANYKDVGKIAANLEAQRASFLEKAALDPITGIVVAFTSAFDDEPPACLLNTGKTAEELLEAERSLLIQAVSLIDDCMARGIAVIGFNSKGFDLKFLFRRSWIHNLPVPALVLGATDRYCQLSIDLLQIWLAGDRDYSGQSLGRICHACGIGEKNGKGGEFAALLKMDPASAKAYAVNDVVLTQKLADRLYPQP